MKGRLFVLIFVNVLLGIGLILILDKIGIIEFHWTKNPKNLTPDEISGDPFLIEKESLRKQWAVLTAKESDLDQRETAFSKTSQTLQEKQKALNAQIDDMNDKTKQAQQTADDTARSEESIRSLASKVVNIPPQSGAAILNDMEPVIAVETIKMIDKMASERGTQSTSAYLISLMDPQKRKEVVRLLSAYPSSLGNLNIPTPPGNDAGGADSTTPTSETGNPTP